MRAGHRFLAWLRQAAEPLRIKATRGDTREFRCRMSSAITSHDIETVRYFLKHGFDPNLRDFNSMLLVGGCTPLHSAVATRAPLPIFDLLLKAGADPHVVDDMAWFEMVDNPQPAALKQMDEVVRAMGGIPKPWPEKLPISYSGRTPRELAESMNLPEIAARLKLAENPEKLPSLESRQLKGVCPVLQGIADRRNGKGGSAPAP